MNKKAFTLAETLITVVILGILAAILVPNLIKNQVENANRTKVKKAMAAYEKAINMMIIENDIKSTEALRDLGQDICQYTREYFKTVQDGSNNCIFKTADRVWWNITDITNPILILKDSQLEKSETELKTLARDLSNINVFAMVGRFDEIGTLRVNDNGFEQSQKNNFTNRMYMTKLWAFINNLQVELTGFAKCNAEGAMTCTIINEDGQELTYTKMIAENGASADYQCKYKYDRENRVDNTQDCSGHTSIGLAGEYWIINFGEISEEESKGDESCSTSTRGFDSCKSTGDYYEAARLKCQKAGGRLANLAELVIARQNGKIGGGRGYWAEEEYFDGRSSRACTDL